MAQGKGGGAKTGEGKAVTRFNPVRHGLRSFAPVIGLEREEDWDRHLRGIITRLSPEDELEAVLAERIAALLWRLKRGLVFETESIEVGLARMGQEWADHRQYAADLAKIPFYGAAADRTPERAWVARREAQRRLPSGATLEKVMRYEAHLQRQLVRMLHELEIL